MVLDQAASLVLNQVDIHPSATAGWNVGGRTPSGGSKTTLTDLLSKALLDCGGLLAWADGRCVTVNSKWRFFAASSGGSGNRNGDYTDDRVARVLEVDDSTAIEARVLAVAAECGDLSICAAVTAPS